MSTSDGSIGEEPGSTRRRVVICIDDDPPVLSAIRRLLRHEPYDVITTLDPDEVLRLISSREVHLIIADQRMPRMQGTELLKTVRRASPGTICVILTGHADLSEIAGAMNDGSVDRLVRKPWDDRDLRTMIHDLLHPQPPERVLHRVDCEGRRPDEILEELSALLDQPGEPAPGKVLALDHLMGLSGSLTVLLSELVRLIVRRGSQTVLIEGTGAAGTYMRILGATPRVMVYRSEKEMGRF